MGSSSGRYRSSQQGPDGGRGTLPASGWRERNEAGHDLPHDCRTTKIMEIAVERKMEFAPRTAVPTPKLLKEIVLTGRDLLQ